MPLDTRQSSLQTFPDDGRARAICSFVVVRLLMCVRCCRLVVRSSISAPSSALSPSHNTNHAGPRLLHLRGRSRGRQGPRCQDHRVQRHRCAPHQGFHRVHLLLVRRGPPQGAPTRCSAQRATVRAACACVRVRACNFPVPAADISYPYLSGWAPTLATPLPTSPARCVPPTLRHCCGRCRSRGAE